VNEKDLLAITGGIQASVFALDHDLRYTAFDRAHAANMREMYGVEITLGARLADCQTVVVDRETSHANLMRALAGERVVASAYSGEPGHERYIDVVHEPLKDTTGEIAGVEVRAFDATRRQAIEEALRESEQQFRALFEGAIEGIYQISPDGHVLAANKAFAAMLGYRSAADLVADVVDAGHQLWAKPDERTHFVGMLHERGIVRGYECQLLRKDGSKIWASLSGQLILRPDGAAACYEGFVEDISERKNAEEVLRETDLQFRTFVEQAPVAICVSRDGICLYANQRLGEMLGLESVDDLVAEPIHKSFAPRMQEASKKRTRRRSLGLGVPSEYESVLLRADGSQLPVQLNVGSVGLRDGPANIAFISDITERKRAEDLLRRSEVMRNVAEHVARTGSWRWDLDPTGFSWSEELFELFDIDRGEFDGDVMSGLQARIHADDVDRFMTARAEALETGEAPTVEFRVIHRDGSEHILHGDSAAERDETGKVVAIVGYFQDVTDRREAAVRLEAAAGEWRETFDAMGDSVSLFDCDGRIVRCNAATVRLTGRAFADVVGHYCEEVFCDRDYADCPRKRAFETGQVETDIIERDSAWLRVTFTPKIDAAGQVVGGVHVVTDITQLHQAEQTAAERSHFLEELLEAIPVPIFCLDATRRYIDENEAYAVSSGHSKGEVIGKTAFDIWPAELAASFDASDRELLNHPERPVEQELELSDPDGTHHWLVTHKAVFSDVSGNPAGIVGVNLDLTEIRRAEQELAASAAQLALTLEGSVAALGATTELRDPYTAGHQRRVAELACAIALELGWNEARLKSLRIGARLHDIGKIILPAEILAKPGRLSETEMQLIRQHAAAGAEVVSSIGFESNVAEMIHQHHERLDGSGYPAGLHDDEILPEARILAVADVVEAMISHRPYRPALPIEVAIAELEDGAGTRYDSETCEIAIELIREKGFTFTE
jgi:PAS domain S-box-containing protein/putative nucleotidyltransferase with HDIG domain